MTVADKMKNIVARFRVEKIVHLLLVSVREVIYVNGFSESFQSGFYGINFFIGPVDVQFRCAVDNLYFFYKIKFGQKFLKTALIGEWREKMKNQLVVLFFKPGKVSSIFMKKTAKVLDVFIGLLDL